MARITIPADAMAREGAVKLVRETQVESYVLTTEGAVMSYLSKPLTDQIGRAFQEGR